MLSTVMCFFFSSRRRHTRSKRDWSSDVCSSDLFFVFFHARNRNSGNPLLDAHIQFRSKAHARAVDLAEDISVMAVFTISQHEICRPYQWNIVSTKLFSNNWASLSKHIHQVLPCFGGVVAVLCTRK